MSDLRPYGPGKFDTMLDAAVYTTSLDGGPDEECGSVETIGWYGLMRGPIIESGEALRDLTPEEQAFMLAQSGCIISEDSQGFVHVEYFESKSEMMRAWAEVLRDEEVFNEEQSDNEE